MQSFRDKFREMKDEFVKVEFVYAPTYQIALDANLSWTTHETETTRVRDQYVDHVGDLTTPYKIGH